MFLKPKNYEVITKGRGCVDGRKHRYWISKEDTSSPTVSTECLILSCMIDLTECQEVATYNIPKDLLKIEYNKGDIHINLAGAMVTLPKEVNPYYYKYSIYTYKRGRKCMYSESKKAIYGALEASLLLWGKLSKILEEMGYQIN